MDAETEETSVNYSEYDPSDFEWTSGFDEPPPLQSDPATEPRTGWGSAGDTPASVDFDTGWGNPHEFASSWGVAQQHSQDLTETGTW